MIKCGKLLIHTATWMNLRIITQGERRQPQKATCMVSLIWNSKKINLVYQNKKDQWLLAVYGGGWELTGKGHKGQDGRTVLYLDCGSDCMDILYDNFDKTHQTVHFKGIYFIVRKLYLSKVIFFENHTKKLAFAWCYGLKYAPQN